MAAGVQIYERRDALLHSKTALIDGVWSTVGSTNLDWRSFLHNDEINAVILGQGFGAQMLAPMIVAALQGSSAFRVVVLSPSTALGELRLDTEILRLQHDFSQQPSRVHFTLRAHLIDNKTRRVIRSQEFDASTPASSDDPYGGVVAANRVVQHVLVELAAFCSDAASAIPPER
jgi:phosphatidylserine/phosphatidylglycerophosphate/cardiolipin synthase-like enzyme